MEAASETRSWLPSSGPVLNPGSAPGHLCDWEEMVETLGLQL